MKKLVIAAALLLNMGTLAMADCNFNGCGPGRYHHRHHGGGGGGGDWAAPLIGGLIIGGMIGSMSQPAYQYPQPRYYGQPRHCEIRDYYDEWGYLVNREKVCW